MVLVKGSNSFGRGFAPALHPPDVVAPSTLTPESLPSSLSPPTPPTPPLPPTPPVGPGGPPIPPPTASLSPSSSIFVVRYAWVRFRVNSTNPLFTPTVATLILNGYLSANLGLDSSFFQTDLVEELTEGDVTRYVVTIRVTNKAGDKTTTQYDSCHLPPV